MLNWAFSQREFEAILDDRAARKGALVHRIPCRGTIGVILAARKQRLIAAAKPVCDQIVQAGLLLDPVVLQGALSLVGE